MLKLDEALIKKKAKEFKILIAAQIRHIKEHIAAGKIDKAEMGLNGLRQQLIAKQIEAKKTGNKITGGTPRIFTHDRKLSEKEQKRLAEVNEIFNEEAIILRDAAINAELLIKKAKKKLRTG